MKVLMFVMILLVNFNLCAENINTTTVKTERKQSNLLKKIKYKLIRLLNPQRTKIVTAVVAVRGNSYDTKNGLYWKTKNSDKLNEKIDNERRIMENIIKMIEDDRIDDAKTELEDFIKTNPQGFFIDDAKKLLNEINSLRNPD